MIYKMKSYVLYLFNNIPSKCDGTVRSVLKICEENLNIL